jgi:hypothetical protein
MNGIAAEQVLHVDVADTRGEAAGFENFRKAGDGFAGRSAGAELPICIPGERCRNRSRGWSQTGGLAVRKMV